MRPVLLGVTQSAAVFELTSSIQLTFQLSRICLGSNATFQYRQAFSMKFAQSFERSYQLAFMNLLVISIMLVLHSQERWQSTSTSSQSRTTQSSYDRPLRHTTRPGVSCRT